MANKLTTLVLVTDGTETSRAAEQTALDLARDHSANVIIVDTMPQKSWIAQWLSKKQRETFDALRIEKLERLEQVAAVFRTEGVEAETDVLIGKSSLAVARKALANEADLVVRYMKGQRSKSMFKRFGMTAVNLMRACPCPLLLVGDQPFKTPKVVACVDAEHSQDENLSILSAAEMLTDNPANRHALYCWEVLAIGLLTDYGDAGALPVFLERTDEERREAHDRFVGQYDLSGFDGGLEVEVGDTSDVIPKYCKDHDIDVAVMSSASTDQPLGLLLGSTLTDVMEELPCSMLIVKPLKFNSPLKTVDTSRSPRASIQSSNVQESV